MAVPSFQEFMLPVLRRAADGLEHRLRDEVDPIANEMKLPQSEREVLLPSGTQTRLYNRVAWACQYLRKAGLLESTGRGRHKITARGRTLLAENPEFLTLKDLERYEEFVEFRNDSKPPGVPTGSESDESVATEGQTPEEMIEQGYEALNAALADEVLGRLRDISPSAFENVVVDVLVAMGYGGSRADAGQAVGRSGDAGIDGIIKEDRLGLDAVYVQAKRWQSTVGRPDIQAFAGSLEGARARKGVFITTSAFSAEAHEYVRMIEKRIVLIDGKQLAKYMVDFGVGVTEVARYTIKAVDSDYFDPD